MNETIEYYNQHAHEFASGTINADMSECRLRFLKYVPAGGKVLDAGCGSGRDTIAFLDAGYDADAFDASEDLCRIASENTGINVRTMRFEELTGENEYDGIWACASLLHVQKKDLPDVLKRMYGLLKPDGILYASFKYGSTERKAGDRYFHDMTDGECSELLENNGFSVLELFMTEDVRPGREHEQWVNVIGRKGNCCSA